MEFKDMVVVVAGGAGGIGEKIAQASAREAGMTIILDSAEEGAQKVVREIESSGGKASAVVVDATKEDKIQDAIAGIAGKFSRIDSRIFFNSIKYLQSSF